AGGGGGEGGGGGGVAGGGGGQPFSFVDAERREDLDQRDLLGRHHLDCPARTGPRYSNRGARPAAEVAGPASARARPELPAGRREADVHVVLVVRVRDDDPRRAVEAGRIAHEDHPSAPADEPVPQVLRAPR